MTIYRPQVRGVLTVPVFGSSAEKDRQAHGTDTITFPIRIKHAEIERNDHLAADSCKVSAEFTDVNVDPRFLKHAVLALWLGSADDDGYWTPSTKDYRFIGICVEASRKLSGDSLEVEMEFRDYTTLFLAQKPYNQKGIPTFQMTLQEAWNLICDHTGYWDVSSGKLVSNVEALKSRLVFTDDVQQDQQLGAGVPERIRKYGKISIKSGDSAWDVWQRCVMALGLISYIDKDQCIVSTTTEYFAADVAPALVLGKNIESASESINNNLVSKGIHMTSYDVTTGKTIEAFYPPPGDPRIHIKRGVAKRKNFDPKAVQSDQYESFEYHDVTDPKILENIARRAYEERSRQEMTGWVKTAEMEVDGIDLLSLGAGDNIRVEIDPDLKDLLKNKGSQQERIQYLLDRGYDQGVAQIMVGNLDALPFLSPVFHTTRVVTSLGEDDFSVTIHYHNRILFSGSTDD